MAAATAAILLGYGALTAETFAGSDAPDVPMPLAARLLYGGISEEIIARWGVLSVAMLGLLKLGASRGVAFWSANLFAGVLFGIGHFGLLFALFPEPPVWLIAAVLAGNLLPALGFGWLFRRYGLEAAMLGHGGGHALALAAGGLVG